MDNKKRSTVPLILTAVIGIFILFLAWSGKQASTGGTDVTDADYYSKGLKYNSTLVEKRAASVIGWKLTSRLEGRTLLIALNDKNNAPISAAHGQLVVGKTDRPKMRSLQLEELQPGNYLVRLPPEMSGEQLVRVDFERDGARINRRLLLNISEQAK